MTEKTTTPCPYCGKPVKSLPLHKKFCKGRTIIPPQTPEPVLIEGDSTPHHPTTPGNTPDKPKGKSIYWAYKALIFIFTLAGILQWFVFQFFKINLWLLLVVYLVDLLIFTFLIWTIWRLRAKKVPVVFGTLEDFIKTVPKWSLDEKAPNKGIIGSIINKGKQYKQLVLVSKNFEPKKLWVEWDGFYFHYEKERAYKPPQGTIRGDVFFYNMDKMTPLIDTVEVTPEDAEDSYQLEAVWNQGVAVGHAEAMSDTQGKIQLILLLVGCVLAAVLILGIYSYSQFSDLNTQHRISQALLYNVSLRTP